MEQSDERLWGWYGVLRDYRVVRDWQREYKDSWRGSEILRDWKKKQILKRLQEGAKCRSTWETVESEINERESRVTNNDGDN